MAMLTIRNLHKSYGNAAILKDINIDIADGSFVVLVGPSGCGKSTLLRMIAGLETVSSGDISIGGKSVNKLAPADRGIAMVFQSYALYPHVDVYGNMGFGLRFAGTPKAEIDRRVMEAARVLQLEHLLKRKPRDLSGGQRQRVAIGRAIVREPDVFLFDEPLSNLDAALRVNTRIEISKLHKLLKATIVYVTHDQVEAMTLADVIVVMNKGRIEQAGKPLDLYYSPANMFVAGFIGSPAMNFLDARVIEAGETTEIRMATGDRLSLPARGALTAGEEVIVGLRPEHLNLGTGGDVRLSGRIELVEALGEQGFAYISCADSKTITVQTSGRQSVQVGVQAEISAALHNVHLFRKDGSAIRP